MLLQNAVKFNLREFQEVWQQSVPEGMSTRLDQLKVSTLKKQHYWCYTRLWSRLSSDMKVLHLLPAC